MMFIISNCQDKLKRKFNEQAIEVPTQDNKLLADEELNRPHMIMPYTGTKGETILKKAIKKIPEKVRPKIIYKGTKLSTFSP